MFRIPARTRSSELPPPAAAVFLFSPAADPRAPLLCIPPPHAGKGDAAGSVELLSFMEEDTTVERPQESDGEEFDFLRSEYASTGAPVAADAGDAAI